MICLCSDALLEARGETEIDSVPKPIAERPSSTPEMDSHEAEEMANSVMLNWPLPNPERSDEKLPEEEENMKRSEERGSEKLPEEIPIGKLIMPCTEGVFPFVLPPI